MNTNRRQFQAPVWKHVKTFRNPAAGVAVLVTKSEGFRPRFSIQVSKELPVREGEDAAHPRMGSHFNVSGQTVNGRVSIVRVGKVVASLLEEAEDWIHAECQIREDEILDDMQAREKKQLDRDKPKVKPGLKQLSKRDASFKTLPSPPPTSTPDEKEVKA